MKLYELRVERNGNDVLYKGNVKKGRLLISEILLASLFSCEELSANFSVSGISNQQEEVTGVDCGYSYGAMRKAGGS